MSVVFDQTVIMEMIKGQVTTCVNELLTDEKVQRMVHESVRKIMQEQDTANINNSVFHEETTTEHPSVQQQLYELANSQNFISAQYDTLCKQLNFRDQIINQRFVRNETNIEEAFVSVDNVEQYSRLDMLEFDGLENIIADEGKSPIEAVVSVINDDLKLTDINANDISAAHGFHKDGVENNSVIYVKFKGRMQRNKVYEERKKLKNARTGNRQKFININLTPYRKGLFSEVKRLDNIKYKWVDKKGNILIRKDDYSRPTKIKSYEQIRRLFASPCPTPNRYNTPVSHANNFKNIQYVMPPNSQIPPPIPIRVNLPNGSFR